MSIGINPDKATIDARLGQACQNVNSALEAIQDLKLWLDGKTEADFTALGYTSTDYGNAVSALADLDQLRTVYEGSATLADAKDFRTFAKRLYGFGV